MMFGSGSQGATKFFNIGYEKYENTVKQQQDDGIHC
jgi:hypothetical protein